MSASHTNRKVASHQPPSEFTGGRADVENVIGRTHHVSVMFDHQHRIAMSRRFCSSESSGRCRVDAAYGWFVEDVERADE